MFWYAFTIFLSSFLLFQVQPIIAKMILPWFGGTAAVWNTCMLFFQLTLLAGYAYAHLIFGKNLCETPILYSCHPSRRGSCSAPYSSRKRVETDWKRRPRQADLGLLIVTLGLPYFVLSTTGSSASSVVRERIPRVVPYRLFALSNAVSDGLFDDIPCSCRTKF